MHRRPYLTNALLLLAALALSAAVGAVFIPPGTVLRMLAARLPGVDVIEDWAPAFNAILFEVRLPHTALVLLTGAALGSSGAAYQGLFRNPLADPYLIGVASGAGLGAVFALTGRWPETMGGFLAVPAAAFSGALLTVFLVYALARTGRSLPVATLILAGVAISAFAGALTSFLMLRSEDELRRAIAWLLGGSPAAGWEPVLAALPFLRAGMGGLPLSGPPPHGPPFGEGQAAQPGPAGGRASRAPVPATPAGPGPRPP